ncbi:Cytochrome P450 71D9, partial [Mucuna pruriens]
LPNGMKSEDLDMTEGFGVTVRRKDDLYLIPITSRPFQGEEVSSAEFNNKSVNAILKESNKCRGLMPV